MRSLVFVFKCLIAAVNITLTQCAENLFEKEECEIRSCLSKDLENHEMKTCRFHAIMIDAGSTGTRAHIFEFSHATEMRGAPFILEKEIFDEVKPGLSEFALQPEDAGRSIKHLIDTAVRVIPSNMHADTPIALKATAGLRLLPEDQAYRILEEAKKVLAKSPFLVGDVIATLLHGTEEGIYAWFTINFLLNRIDAILLPRQELSEQRKDRWTATALDLGGGSTQVTLMPMREESFLKSPPDYIHTVRVFDNDVVLYSHSYSGNGLLSSRLSIIQLSSREDNDQTKILTTPCMTNNWNFIWKLSGSWNVSGTDEYSFTQCEKYVRKFVIHSDIHKLQELQDSDIYAFSYFYDRAFQANLVPKNKGGYVTINMFLTAAQNACIQTAEDYKIKGEHWRPWQCLDLTYIYTLLTEGYKLNSDTEIYLAKKLRDNMEASWALGAAYHLLNTYHEQNRMENNPSGNSMFGVFVNRSLSYMCNFVYEGMNSMLVYFQLLA